MKNNPDRLFIDKKDRKLFNTLKKEIFKDIQNKDQFLFAMSIGYKNNAKRVLDSKEGFFLSGYMNLEDKALINSIAIAEKGSIDVLDDTELVYSISQEYAHGGIRLLHDEATTQQYGSFIKQFEKEIIDILGTIK